MAYDSETYGQSPFGNSTKKVTRKASSLADSQNESGSSAATKPSDDLADALDDGLDIGPGELPSSVASSPALASPQQATTTSRATTKSSASKASSSKAGVSKGSSSKAKSKKDTAVAEAAAFAKAFQPDNVPPAVGRIAGKLGLGKTLEKLTNGTSADPATGKSKRKSRTTAKSASKKSSRKGSKRKQTKAEAAAQAEAEAAVARRFQAEDRRAYLALLHKTGISMLIWAVLRLSRHQLSDNPNAIALINILIHPLLVAAVTIVAMGGLTFWLRRLLNDLARHTQQLGADAEETGGKNYRPTLEIVGDSLEYNPQLRKNFALLFDVTSMLLCTLVSYLITSAVLP